MTTYYNKPLEAVSSAIFDVNPALYTGIASKVGRFPLNVPDPHSTEWVHFNAITKAGKVRFANEPGWDAIPDSLPNPGLRKAKCLYWNMNITELQMQSLISDPNGLVAQQIRAEIQNQQDLFVARSDHYLSGYLYAATDDDYDAEWMPLFKMNAIGTVSNPADINAVPGTITATGIKTSGAGRVTDAFEKCIGLIKERFYQQYDANTYAAMYRNTNTFDLWVHPAVYEKLKMTYNFNAGGYSDYTRNYIEIAQSIGISVIPTFSVDAAYDAANGTVAEAVLTMNTAENFLIAELVPYTVSEWKHNDATRCWEMRAEWRILPMIKPYLIGGLWKKAMTSFSFIPYAES